MKAFCVLLAVTCCVLGPVRAKPNILLIVSEDNGPELGCYGDPYVQTPVLDGLAEEGVRFENASVPYSVCSPSRACFLTGLYPHQNGQIGLATHKFAMYREWPNLFTVLKAAGYRTGLIGKLHVNPEPAFPVDYRAIRGANFGKRNMRDYAEAAGKFFAGDGEAPFFLSINYPDAHYPLHRQQFGLPEEPLDGEDVKPLPWVGADSERLREFTANYYNCMRRLDDGVGMLLEELEKSGVADDTLIIYIGDHGAQFSRGKCSVYEAGLRVPFIVHWRGRIKGGQVREELVSTLDIMPTLCGVAGVEAAENLVGYDLAPLLAGRCQRIGGSLVSGLPRGRRRRFFVCSTRCGTGGGSLFRARLRGRRTFLRKLMSRATIRTLRGGRGRGRSLRRRSMCGWRIRVF